MLEVKLLVRIFSKMTLPAQMHDALVHRRMHTLHCTQSMYNSSVSVLPSLGSPLFEIHFSVAFKVLLQRC